MPYTFLFVIVALFLVPVCFIGTMILCFLFFVLPVLIKKSKPASSGKPRIWKRIFLSLLFSFLCAIVIPIGLLLLGGGIVWIDSMDSTDYWKYNGSMDYFRMPLEPPYELVMVDIIDNASIQIWQDSSGGQLWDITCYEKRGALMFGETSKDHFASERPPEEKEWFIFDLSNGDKILFQNEDEFVAALHDKGIVEFNLKTVQQNWNEYWENPRSK